MMVLDNRIIWQISYMLEDRPDATCSRYLLAIPSRERLERVLRYLLDENELLSPYGVRSLSRVHRDQPFELKLDGEAHVVRYVPGESETGLFGGNSNWRGPVWFPLNYHHQAPAPSPLTATTWAGARPGRGA
jgi:hypothetical protein